MLVPRTYGQDIFDSWFGFPEFREPCRIDRRLYGENAGRLMKTDIRENENGFELDIDLPGFKKEDILLQLDKGYLSVSAKKTVEEEKTSQEGKIIRQERFSGSMRRSFYVGEHVTEEDVKAKFEDGVLSLSVPKQPAPQIPEPKTITIE